MPNRTETGIGSSDRMLNMLYFLIKITRNLPALTTKRELIRKAGAFWHNRGITGMGTANSGSFSEVLHSDPFLTLDDFRSDNSGHFLKGFPWHPHRGITDSQIPEIELDSGVRTKIIAGTVDGISGPVKDIIINPEYLDCTIPEKMTYVHSTIAEHTAFIYVINDNGVVNDTQVDNRTLILFDNGDEFSIRATGNPVRFLLLTGKPLNEPVALRGPIVTNTESELETAFREYQAGTFVKHG